jgi:DNA polymerase III sliding clamp (beta) subunit (PCNA family)
MNNLTIKASLIRAAQACQGNKDVRYYLNGILLAANGDVVGTNGHVLFKGSIIGAGQQIIETDTIIHIDGKVPVSADTVTFDFTDDTRGVCTTDTGKAFTFTVIDGKYPDYQRVMPKEDRAVFSNGFTCQSKYIALALSVFGKESKIDIIHASENEQVVISCLKMPDCLFVVMPCRSEYNFLTNFERGEAA